MEPYYRGTQKTTNLLIENKYCKGKFTYGFEKNIIDRLSYYIQMIFVYLYNLLAKNMLMDIFMMRRLLDKNYITNIIVYTGHSHSLVYIYSLVKYFSFKITNWSYLSDDVKTVHDKINDSHHIYELSKYFLPPVLLQCSKLDNFPDLFN